MLAADSPVPVPAPPVPHSIAAADTASVALTGSNQAKGQSWSLFHQNNPRNDRVRDRLGH
ncbi:hypothetical protein LFM09_38420 [Lentzea alba]|uniref:hypothetical protein n=1 Tax=Lentzea alba TaxID=2714351 RepID=UPI0039BED1AA